ncbi:hypothetical protein P170DRAFT_232467 [Aspergillus steynii IBT 23096]|uniref:Uncharacterized protein n=1 Tax=Aspergillus steynii IBT 23096 TaxID=1392250 RepID=A0A2I2G2D1_9EURO|nr:uncharacterized protein P170DRAFT_232467 [Aspergillus steynii IBT 23096]PLB47040.1 hypothetical protein P170DRAFT_232467 [Aspergillus steynii IBT 23096]
MSPWTPSFPIFSRGSSIEHSAAPLSTGLKSHLPDPRDYLMAPIPGVLRKLRLVAFLAFHHCRIGAKSKHTVYLQPKEYGLIHSPRGISPPSPTWLAYEGNPCASSGLSRATRTRETERSMLVSRSSGGDGLAAAPPAPIITLEASSCQESRCQQYSIPSITRCRAGPWRVLCVPRANRDSPCFSFSFSGCFEPGDWAASTGDRLPTSYRRDMCPWPGHLAYTTDDIF